MTVILRALQLLFVLLTISCTASHPSREPLGETFPSVRGTILTGDEVSIPGFFSGSPVLLLVAYKQGAQFDVDRWVLGLLQLQTPVELAEIPTVQGFFPGLIRGTIDEGMRNGIPKEDWGLVYTVYEDSEEIAKFLGNDKPRNVRAVLLDKDGKVVWFHDRGFSPAKALELDRFYRTMSSPDNVSQ